MEKNDLISRAAALDVLVTSPNFHTTLTRIEELPTVDAIPVEWLKAREMEYYGDWGVVPVSVEEALTMWQDEQEART